MSVVSTWKMTRRSSSFRRLSHRGVRANDHHIVELAQTCIAAFAFSPFSTYCSVALYASKTQHETAHVPSCALERAPIAGYVFSPQGIHLFGSDCRGSSQNRVLSQSCASGRKKDGPY